MALIEMDGCSACSLRAEWPNLAHPVMQTWVPSLPSSPRVLVIGEAPGEEEDKEGRPFVGKTGAFLRKHLLDNDRDTFYWTNTVRCRPPKNRLPLLPEVECCTRGFLAQDLQDINPNVILVVGDVALRYFVQGESISVLRGLYIPYEFPDGGTCWLYPIFHPSYVLRGGDVDARPGTDKFNALYPVFRSDIARFKELLHTTFRERPQVIAAPTRSEIFYPKSAKEAEMLVAQMQGKPTVDIETSKKKPYMRSAKLLTAAISDGTTTIAFPVEWPNVIPWGKQFLREFLLASGVWKAHNAGFELVWFLHRFPELIEQRNAFECTMAKARFLHHRTRILSADTQTLIHLGTPIKDETAITGLGILRRNDEEVLRYPLEEVLYYNGLDAWGQARLDDTMTLEDNQLENYARALDTIESTTIMEFYGLSLNMARSFELKTVLQAKADETERRAWLLHECMKFEKEYGRKVRLSAPDDIAIVMIKYLGLKLPESAQKKYSTDNEALSKYTDTHEFPQYVLDHREVSVQKRTFVEPIISGEVVGVDGLLHPAYSVVLTATLRLSSMDPNIQNFPKRKNKEVREQVIPPPGFIIAGFDIGQGEARVLGMHSRDRNLCQSIIRGEDIHSKWLNRILEIYPGYFDRLVTKTGQHDEKALRKAGRDIIKTDFVFASFYGSVAGSVAARTGIPLNIVQDVWGEFWAEYQGVRYWQQSKFEEYLSKGSVSTLCGMLRNEVLPGNEPINTPIQSDLAQLVVAAQNELWGMSKAQHDIILAPRWNVHDDLLFFLPDTNDAERYIEVIGSTIVQPRFDFMCVPLMTECRVGYDWAHLDAVGKFVGAYFE